MKFMKDLKVAVASHVECLEESMAKYVEYQDRMSHCRMGRS